MNQSAIKIFILSSFLVIITGCATPTPVHVQAVESPLGLYRSNTDAQYWLAILQNDVYLVCSTSDCQNGIYERVPADYGVILLEFYRTEIGQSIEKQIHGPNKSAGFLQAMTEIRLSQPRPHDLVFNITDCEGTPCVGIGHSREGVKFYRIESFDSFWNK